MRTKQQKRYAIDADLLDFYKSTNDIYWNAMVYCEALGVLSTSQWAKDRESVEPPPARAERESYSDPHWSDYIIGHHNLKDDMDREIKYKNSYFIKLSIVSLWGIIEAKFDDAIFSFVVAAPQVLERQEFTKISTPAAPFMRMSQKQKIQLILHEYKEKHGGPFKKGIGRFEMLSDAVGLGKGVPEEIKRAFMEMSEFRHNIVHRMGIADKKFAESCPWLGLVAGCKYGIQMDALQSYGLATKYYIMELDRRIRIFFGEKIPDRVAYDQSFYLSRVIPIVRIN